MYVRLTVGGTGVYWLFPAGSRRPGKVMANAFSAGFHRFIHRFLAVPVGSRVLTVASGEDEGVMVGDDVEWCVEGPAGGFGGALVFTVSWWWSGCRHSVVTSVMAARVEDSSTMALPAA